MDQSMSPRTPPQGETLQPLLERLARPGSGVAVIALRRQGADTWSYERLAGEVAQLAGGLRDHGIAPGEPVAVMAEPRPEWIAACLGIIACGAVVVPVDTQFNDETLRHVLEDSEVRLIFTVRRKLDQLGRLGLERSPRLALFDSEAWDENHWGRLAGEPAPFEAPAPEAPAALFYTSGTTGPPKGVPLSHRNLAFQPITIERAGIVRGGDRVLLPLPLHHVYPFAMGLLAPLWLGLPVVIPEALTGPQVLRAIQEGEATVIIGVPRLYRALVEGIETRLASAGRVPKTAFGALLALSGGLNRMGLPLGRRLFGALHRQFGPRLRLLASGGAALNPQLGRTLQALGWEVAIGYGLTETAPLLTLARPGEAPLESVGRPVPGVEIRIDTTGAPTEGGHASGVGEILARGPNVFEGYRHLPEKTAEAFAEGWFRTGDLGRLDRHGNLFLLGRASTLLVTEGGENVQPEEVEEAYQAHPLIREIGVFQRDGPLLGVVVPESRELRRLEGEAEAHVRGALAEVARGLPSYQRVGEFALSREPLARTRLGKLQRHLLAERFVRARREGAGEAPAGPLSLNEMAPDDRELLEQPPARLLWDWLAARYPQHRLTPDTSPQLDLGVDSMEWLNLTMEIGERLGVELDDEVIARVESVRDLLHAMVEATGTGKGAMAPTERLKRPEAVISERQRRWLRPLGPGLRALQRLIYALDWVVMRGAFRLRVQGAERLDPNAQYIFAPNHLSHLDPFAVAIALGYRRVRTTYWGGWTGAAFRNAILRFGSRIAQVVPVDAEQGPLSSLALGAAVLKGGYSLVWFPEGGRSPDGELQPFKPGIGLLLESTPLPVVPVVVVGSRKALPRGTRIPRPVPIEVRVGAPVDPDQLEREGEGELRRDRLASGLHRRVAALLSQSD